MSRLKPQPAALAFSDVELVELERRYPDGVTSADIIRLFQARGVKLSEGTFRKYVQLRLLPRSKRIGKKGKHKGSKGIYPTSIVRQITAIKRMMAEGLTIEQIQRSWLRFRPRIEGIETDIVELLEEMRNELQGPHFDSTRRGRLEEDLRDARSDAADLILRFQRLEQAVAWSPEPADEESVEDVRDEGSPTGRFF
ncbi:MAG: MerR family transcriptional regulator [bacterium]